MKHQRTSVLKLINSKREITTMRIGKYEVSADKHQFILSEVKINTTIKDGVKGTNYGEEQLINPTFHMSWNGVVDKLIKLELVASVNDCKHIQHVAQAFSINLLKLEDEAKKQLGR